MKNIFLILFFIPFTLFGADKNFYKDWSIFLGSFADQMMTGVNNSDTLSAMLFNSFSENSGPMFSWPISSVSTIAPGMGIDAGVGRKVIYNYNIDNSYTVIDKMLVGVKPEFTAMWSGVKASVRSKLFIYVTNVRQVGPTDYDRLEPLDKKIEDLKERFRIEKNRKYTPAEIQADNDTYANFLPSNKEKIERKATFGRIWNPVTMSFRLPLSANAAERMGESEIMEYTLLGGIELSAGLGVGFAPGFGGGPDSAGAVLRTGVDASIYFKGSYEEFIFYRTYYF